jgi:hypothetical protein
MFESKVLNVLPSLEKNLCVNKRLDFFIVVLRNQGLKCRAYLVGEKRVVVGELLCRQRVGLHCCCPEEPGSGEQSGKKWREKCDCDKTQGQRVTLCPARECRSGRE